MPKLTKVDPQTLKSKPKTSERQHTRAEYDFLLAQFQPLDGLTVDLDEGETKETVKKRLEAAAKRRKCWIKWYRGKANQLRGELRPNELTLTDLDTEAYQNVEANQ